MAFLETGDVASLPLAVGVGTGVGAFKPRPMRSVYDLRRGRRVVDVLALIEVSEVTEFRQETHTLGLLILRTTARPVGEYIDIVVANIMGKQGHARLHRLEEELGASLADLEVERGGADKPHPRILGSSSFKFIRVCKAVGV